MAKYKITHPLSDFGGKNPISTNGHKADEKSMATKIILLLPTIKFNASTDNISHAGNHCDHSVLFHFRTYYRVLVSLPIQRWACYELSFVREDFITLKKTYKRSCCKQRQ